MPCFQGDCSCQGTQTKPIHWSSYELDYIRFVECKILCCNFYFFILLCLSPRPDTLWLREAYQGPQQIISSFFPPRRCCIKSLTYFATTFLDSRTLQNYERKAVEYKTANPARYYNATWGPFIQLDYVKGKKAASSVCEKYSRIDCKLLVLENDFTEDPLTKFSENCERTGQ